VVALLPVVVPFVVVVVDDDCLQVPQALLLHLLALIEYLMELCAGIAIFCVLCAFGGFESQVVQLAIVSDSLW
jgi:hypothetical protein